MIISVIDIDDLPLIGWARIIDVGEENLLLKLEQPTAHAVAMMERRHPGTPIENITLCVKL